jgi:hypothetical protein
MARPSPDDEPLLPIARALRESMSSSPSASCGGPLDALAAMLTRQIARNGLGGVTGNGDEPQEPEAAGAEPSKAPPAR